MGIPVSCQYLLVDITVYTKIYTLGKLWLLFDLFKCRLFNLRCNPKNCMVAFDFREVAYANRFVEDTCLRTLLDATYTCQQNCRSSLAAVLMTSKRLFLSQAAMTRAWLLLNGGCGIYNAVKCSEIGYLRNAASPGTNAKSHKERTAVGSPSCFGTMHRGHSLPPAFCFHAASNTTGWMQWGALTTLNRTPGISPT